MANSSGQCPTCGHPAAPDAAAASWCERCGSPIALSVSAAPDDDFVIVTTSAPPEQPPAPPRDRPPPPPGTQPPPPPVGFRPPPRDESRRERRDWPPGDDERGGSRRRPREVDDDHDDERRPRRRKRREGREKPAREKSRPSDDRTDYSEDYARTLAIGGLAAVIGVLIIVFSFSSSGAVPGTGGDAYNVGKTVGVVFGIILLLGGLATLARSLLR